MRVESGNILITPEAKHIVVAGATGYVGQATIPRLLARFPHATVTALSRGGKKSADARVRYVPCDLFSLKSLESALPAKVDIAVYLVHSMGPTAQLDQGSFSDFDVILADNFARAMKRVGVEQVIYLGALIPDEADLSPHLKSRLEVEEVFRANGLSTTVFRAGLILGETGSSTQILLKLVQRLPVMICPSWTQSETSPVDLPTVVDAIAQVAGDPETYDRVFDLAGCRPLPYVEMMRQTARKLGLRRHFLKVPFFTSTLSRLWVSLITNSPRSLVYPLVQSLRHPMVARSEHAFPGTRADRTYLELLENVPLVAHPSASLFRFQPRGQTVRSVQRLPLPPGRDAAWVTARYLSWLPRFLRPLVRVRIEGDTVEMSLVFVRGALLVLKLSRDRSTPDRQLLYIVGGLLQQTAGNGRLEFREVLGGRHVLAAIHDYTPSLPWLVYKLTQARLHLFVMKRFGRFLSRTRNI